MVLSPSAFMSTTGPQATADQPLNFLGAAALLALGRLTITAGVRRTRQHAVLGRHPALALAFQEAGHLLLDRRRAQHPGLPETDQHGPFGMAREATLDVHLTHLLRPAPRCHDEQRRRRGWKPRSFEAPLGHFRGQYGRLRRPGLTRGMRIAAFDGGLDLADGLLDLVVRKVGGSFS